MCFSAEASFGMSAVLLPAGVYCVMTAAGRNRAFLCLAIIPIIFGVQQFAEGVVWIGLGQDDGKVVRAASVVFLAFALAFWPFWIPFSAFLLEPGTKKKCVLGCFAALGLIGGLVMFVPLTLNSQFLETRPIHHSLYYDMTQAPAFQWLPMIWWEIAYVAIVAVPPMLSRTTGFFFFSIGIVISASLTHVFFWYASASVWCFFAAVLSLYLCFCLHGLPRFRSLGVTRIDLAT
jgi:Family of unknown function (DUF6629)